MNYLFGQIARYVPSSLPLGSPTDKSEIPIWFPQSNVTKSNVTKPLLQIGFLTHWKEGSGILVRRATGTAGLLIFRQFWLLRGRGGQTAARKVQTTSENMWEKYFLPNMLDRHMYFFLQRKQQQQSITEIKRNDKISVEVSIPHFQNSRLVQFLSNINQHVSMYIQCSLLALANHNTCSKSLLHGSMQLRANSKYTQNTLTQGVWKDKQISLPFSSRFLLVGLATYWEAFCKNARVVFIILICSNCKSAQPRPLTQPG